MPWRMDFIRLIGGDGRIRGRHHCAGSRCSQRSH
jgi:hypothetical protein